MKPEAIITWNVPNFITIVLMIALVWGTLGIGSSFFRSKTTANKVVNAGVISDNNGNLAMSM